MIEGPDGVEYGYAADCGRALAESGVRNAADRVRDWIRRGLLEPAGALDGRSIYSMTDVQRVELATRKAGRRRNDYCLAV